MILRSISAQAWRCFAEPIEVGPFSDGLNVVCGPNGIGKSSLFMALGRALFDDHTSSAEAIKQLRPWGRELAPRVTIEFEHGGETYRLTKQFLDGKSAELARREGTRFTPQAEGRAADKQVRDLLQGEAYGRRDAAPASWGLAQVLWAPQGRIDVGQVAGPCKQALQQALGAQIVGAETGAVEERIEELYLASFTPTGKYKSGASAPPVVGLEAKLEEARQNLAQLRQRMVEFDDASRRIEDCAHLASQSQAKREALECDLARARQRAEEFEKLAAEVARCQHAAEAAKARFAQIQERIEAIAAAERDVKSLEQQLSELEAQAPALASEVAQRKGVSEAASATADKIRERRDEPAAARRLAQSAERLARAREVVTRLQPRIGQIEEVLALLQELVEQRRPIAAPDKKQLQALDKAARARDDARLRLEASLITLEITPTAALSLNCLAGEESGTRTLPAGEPTILRGAPGVAVAIAGVGTIRAAGPAESAGELRDQLQRANDRLRQLLQGFDTENLDELQGRREAADVLERELDQARIRRDALLGESTPDDLRAELAQAEQTIAAILAEQPAWSDQPPSPAACTAEAERIERQFTQDIDAAESRCKEAIEAVNRAAGKLSLHQQSVQHAQSQLVMARARHEQLTSDGLSPTQRAERQTEAAIEHQAARKQLAEAQQRLAGFGGDPRQEVKVLEGQVDAVRKQAADASETLHREEGRLKTLIDQAPYSALAIAEERVCTLEEEIARQRLQLDAVKLLYDTLVRRKRELVESLLGPVCQRAMQTLSRIAGSRFSRLELSEDFSLEGVVPAAAGEAVRLDQLSGGEQEQAHFAVRLALADVAFAGRRELVVLDDVFTFTDTARIARIATILAEAAERFQIILLTCHPERYRALPGAKFFDVEEYARAGRG